MKKKIGQFHMSEEFATSIHYTTVMKSVFHIIHHQYDPITEMYSFLAHCGQFDDIDYSKMDDLTPFPTYTCTILTTNTNFARWKRV